MFSKESQDGLSYNWMGLTTAKEEFLSDLSLTQPENQLTLAQGKEGASVPSGDTHCRESCLVEAGVRADNS